MSCPSVLDAFLPPVRQWFVQTLGEPTAPQRQGWPSILAGQNTLILAPTGSGKTLAAFLACLDQLWRQEQLPRGVQVLYISPLKALNNDIYRNLQEPLQGVTQAAQAMNFPLPAIACAVRTGDTPTAERQRLVRHPPHVLITTPESLHLLLTSKARETLRSVRYCIVDEIHAVCTNKRGVFLALLLERLEALTPRSFVRIGLSATQRPLEEVARYLGGSVKDVNGQWQPRPVMIVNAGLRKHMDLQVVCPVEHFGPLPEKSVWPSIYRLLADEIRGHRSTIIFANDRRSAERITAALNEMDEPESGMGAASDTLPLARAHHGSVALEVRQATEQALKEGRLPAVVATASLEMGIDMGAVELVCQVASPGNIARGLQRVGRAGHLVGQRSQGRLIPRNMADLLEQAVLAREMLAGHVEECRVPSNCLDVLAQQIVAMVALEAWPVPKLLDVLRQAYPYRDLSPAALDAVLEMLTGRYRFTREVEKSPPSPPTPLPGVPERGAESGSPLPGVPERGAESGSPLPEVPERGKESGSPRPGTSGRGVGGEGDFQSSTTKAGHTLSALQPRISWDRVHNRLLALPGSQQLALLHGGTIPATGQYAAYTTSGVRIGELDEEFVYERRVGEAFLLGTNTWRVEKIEADRILVSPTQGVHAFLPFWRGEGTGRSCELGLALGRFLRELNERLESADCQHWLQENFPLDAAAARNLRWHVLKQREKAGCLPTDRTICIEASRDPLGDWQVILLTPRGRQVHLALRLALESRLKARLGYRPQCLHHDDGVLVRLTDCAEPVLDLLDGLTADNVQTLVIDELMDSPLFALRFRQNAARALLLPTGGAGKRAPLWLQRLRGRDLLQVARRHADFPIVVETVRECLHDYLDLARVQRLLTDIAQGNIAVVAQKVETPSPFAAGLLFAFTAVNMYQFDTVEPDAGQRGALDQDLLQQLLTPPGAAPLLDPRAIQQVDRRLRGVGRPPRSSTEMAEWLRRLGDLSAADLEGPMAAFLEELQADGRVTSIDLPDKGQRWILVEEAGTYQQAFGLMGVDNANSPHPQPLSPEYRGEGSSLAPLAPWGRGAGGEGLELAPLAPVLRGEGSGVRGESSATAAAPATRRQAAETILLRFLNTHALVSLGDILQRYPFDADWARTTLERWSRQGRLVALPPTGETLPLQWSAPENLEQVQHSTLGLLRREVVTAPPHQFADFVLRWQGVHPEAQTEGHDMGATLEMLQGILLPAELWEEVILLARQPRYQPRQLDEQLQAGAWTWFCQGEGDSGPGQLAFVRRDLLPELPPPVRDAEVSQAAERVLTCLQQRGALFVVDISQATGLPPSAVRAALWQLVRRGLASNDRFDPIRTGELPSDGDITARSALRRRSARRAAAPPEGRWALLPWLQPDMETQAVSGAMLLLQRYGVAARELAQLDNRLPPWRVLYEVLSRMEMAGEVRRGYLVEGLSGAQFALPEAVKLLQETIITTTQAPAILLHSLDPANLYGSGAPFDIPLLDGGTRSLLRRVGNWLVVSAGRPVLLIEQQGRKITTLPSASAEQVVAAVARLPDLLRHDRILASRHRLTISAWNAEPVAGSPGQKLLENLGFVRDYQDMTLYAAWQ